MEELKIGDKVFTRRVGSDIKRGKIYHITKVIDPINGGYMVYYYAIKDEMDYNVNFGWSYNIFPGSDKIWLDKESQRDDVIDNLIC
jgi:hypothetical protein